jgi:hypothetical protein
VSGHGFTGFFLLYLAGADLDRLIAVGLFGFYLGYNIWSGRKQSNCVQRAVIADDARHTDLAGDNRFQLPFLYWLITKTAP